MLLLPESWRDVCVCCLVAESTAFALTPSPKQFVCFDLAWIGWSGISSVIVASLVVAPACNFLVPAIQRKKPGKMATAVESLFCHTLS